MHPTICPVNLTRFRAKSYDLYCQIVGNRSTKICGAVKLECVSDAKGADFAPSNFYFRLVPDQFEIDTLEDTMHLENLDYDFDFHQSACDCKPFCAELKYAVDVSVSEWDWHDSYHELSTDTDFNEYFLWF